MRAARARAQRAHQKLRRTQTGILFSSQQRRARPFPSPPLPLARCAAMVRDGVLGALRPKLEPSSCEAAGALSQHAAPLPRA